MRHPQIRTIPQMLGWALPRKGLKEAVDELTASEAGPSRSAR